MRNMLTLADREEISRGLAEGLEYKEIARLIDRNPSVVSRDEAAKPAGPGPGRQADACSGPGRRGYSYPGQSFPDSRSRINAHRATRRSPRRASASG